MSELYANKVCLAPMVRAVRALFRSFSCRLSLLAPSNALCGPNYEPKR